MIDPEYEDWLPEHEDDAYGSYDENYDNLPHTETDPLDLPTDYALEAPQTPVERDNGYAWGHTPEDPIDRYCFLYWA